MKYGGYFYNGVTFLHNFSSEQGYAGRHIVMLKNSLQCSNFFCQICSCQHSL